MCDNFTVPQMQKTSQNKDKLKLKIAEILIWTF